MPTSDYPIIPIERHDDLHNLDMATEADLVVFMAGNQFMMMPELITAFQQRYPAIQKIYYQTTIPTMRLLDLVDAPSHSLADCF